MNLDVRYLGIIFNVPPLIPFLKRRITIKYIISGGFKFSREYLIESPELN